VSGAPASTITAASDAGFGFQLAAALDQYLAVVALSTGGI